ncbi:tumor protein p53-inducible protein 13 isoform X2 [Kryptolebias marmoratus]|uniref:tumor protein p53-inducible protein 13 isoform X2 n=1 Tax=Kryptolebias marmoratus TaxID=37003 RepID=UPI0018ACAB7E|nr:tumor protein p53-inducible protein 13 isoform X2 [Kryptolebias marmoratus]
MTDWPCGPVEPGARRGLWLCWPRCCGSARDGAVPPTLLDQDVTPGSCIWTGTCLQMLFIGDVRLWPGQSLFRHFQISTPCTTQSQLGRYAWTDPSPTTTLYPAAWSYRSALPSLRTTPRASPPGSAGPLLSPGLHRHPTPAAQHKQDVCDWLQITQSTRPKFDGVTQTGKYNLLLTRSAGLNLLEGPTEMKDSLRRCCEQTISSLLRGTTDGVPSTKKERLNVNKRRNKSRRIRAAVGEQEYNSKKPDETTNGSSQTNRTIPQRPESGQNDSSTHGSSSAESVPGKRTPSDPSVPGSALQPQIQDLPSVAATPSVPESSLQSDSSGLKDSQVSGPKAQPNRKEVKHSGLSGGGNNKPSQITKPEVLAAVPKDEGTNSVKQEHKDSAPRSEANLSVDQKMKDNTMVDVAEREVDRNLKLSDVQSSQKSEKAASRSASKVQPESQLQPEAHGDANGKGGGGENHPPPPPAAAVKVGLQRTPRTDEAVWAAAALGFLFILLTLSILHTRLYRHWRTTPSLYWHDPQKDYDSVADVIRRRLRIAKKRRKRSRRQECVLLPSSSSSDERP